MLRGLLDSGCTKTIILSKFTSNHHKGTPVKYSTCGSTLSSNTVSNVAMKLTEFSTSKEIVFLCQIDSANDPKKALYDIILGSDFMAAMKIDLQYSVNQIKWDGLAIPMRSDGSLTSRDLAEAIHFAHKQPPLLQEVEER